MKDDRDRGSIDIDDWEIALIQGLYDQGMSQQEIIARFSFPHRTLHHNIVSEIANRAAWCSQNEYDPASRFDCEAFLRLTNGTRTEHIWALTFTRPSSSGPSTDSFCFSYRYHPVGQGMFCSGRLTRPIGADFRWVYDCGTDRGRNPRPREHVKREIASLRDEPTSADPPHLDLVTLSHFDTDHLSGLLDLISEFTIGTLLLPYLTPWDRLIIALIEDTDVGDDLLDFLVEPTAFLLERAGEGRIGRILLVPSGGEGPALPPLLPPDERPPDGGETVGLFPEIIAKEVELPGEDEDGAAGPDGGLASGKVGILPRGGALTISRAWEFVPYNDARLAGLADAEFRAKTQGFAEKLNRAVPYEDRDAALDELKALYQDTFKAPGARTSTSHQRNEISLFLYSGPIGRVNLIDAKESIPRHRLEPLRVERPRSWIGRDRFGQMFTGDGYLKTDRQWDDFQAFYGPFDRLYRGAIFQVMHHGSKANWRDEVATLIKPQASIVCSDPAHTLGHPDWPVLKALKPYNPKQVDLVHGWCFEGRYRFD